MSHISRPAVAAESARYAVYFAPERPSPWWAFGAHWLGRNEFDNTPMTQPTLAGLTAPELAAITAEPRRYGFHATLKAPFHLAAGHDESDLMTRLDRLSRRLAPTPLGGLQPAAVGNFVALVPDDRTAEGVQALASACVSDLDDLRAPLGEADLARRHSAGLDARESELLALYGYPHVMERFRLHLTLTGPVDAATARRVIDAATGMTAGLNAQAPPLLDRLCLFVEPSRGAPFQRIMDVRLGA